MPDVCLVLPCFNEASRLRADTFIDALRLEPRLSLCFVDDGSSDATAQVLSTLAAQARERISIVRLPTNRGKAEAVRHGVQTVWHSFAFVGYWDADLSTPLAELSGLLNTLERRPHCAAAIGSRWRRLGSRIERNPVRHAGGRVFATLASLAVDLPVYDSQCGAKVFRAETARKVFAEPFISRWCFDVELLARLKRDAGHAAINDIIVEVPLGEWHEVGGSKLRPSHTIGMLLDLWRIRAQYGR